jgi:cytochrome o ubiquinol oxidase subunit 2
MCTSEMMAIDARGGLGKAGIENVSLITYDKVGNGMTAQAAALPTAEAQRQLAWVRALCQQHPGAAPDAAAAAPSDQRPLTGAGLALPRPIAPGGNAAASERSILISRN